MSFAKHDFPDYEFRHQRVYRVANIPVTGRTANLTDLPVARRYSLLHRDGVHRTVNHASIFPAIRVRPSEMPDHTFDGTHLLLDGIPVTSLPGTPTTLTTRLLRILWAPPTSYPKYEVPGNTDLTPLQKYPGYLADPTGQIWSTNRHIILPLAVREITSHQNRSNTFAHNVGGRYVTRKYAQGCTGRTDNETLKFLLNATPTP